MIVVSCNYDVGSMDDLIELFMMGGYTIYFLSCGKIIVISLP